MSAVPEVSEAAIEAARQTLPEAWRPIVRDAIARAALAAAAPEIARAAKVEALRGAARRIDKGDQLDDWGVPCVYAVTVNRWADELEALS